MSHLTKPAGLNEAYHLNGPDRMYITGPLSAARAASGLKKWIQETAGTRSQWWPTLDSALFFLADVPAPHPQEVRRIHQEDALRAIADLSPYHEVLFVYPEKKLDRKMAFHLGRIVASEQIERVYYYGKDSSLGELREPLEAMEKFQVIEHPVEVYRWEAPGGFAVKAQMEAVRL